MKTFSYSFSVTNKFLFYANISWKIFLQIWAMIEQSRMHLQEGHMSIMWKDTTFNYAYFLWFEDNSVSTIYKNYNIFFNAYNYHKLKENLYSF